jgi:DNA-binding MarR family transcriptional regulator
VAAEEQIAAFAEWQRLRALATPLRDWLLAQEFDGRVIHTSPATPRRLAKRAHRDPAEVKAVLDELVTEGLIRKVGNGYDSLAMADGGDG